MAKHSHRANSWIVGKSLVLMLSAATLLLASVSWGQPRVADSWPQTLGKALEAARQSQQNSLKAQPNAPAAAYQAGLKVLMEQLRANAAVDGVVPPARVREAVSQFALEPKGEEGLRAELKKRHDPENKLPPDALPEIAEGELASERRRYRVVQDEAAAELSKDAARVARESARGRKVPEGRQAVAAAADYLKSALPSGPSSIPAERRELWRRIGSVLATASGEDWRSVVRSMRELARSGQCSTEDAALAAGAAALAATGSEHTARDEAMALLDALGAPATEMRRIATGPELGGGRLLAQTWPSDDSDLAELDAFCATLVRYARVQRAALKRPDCDPVLLGEILDVIVALRATLFSLSHSIGVAERALRQHLNNALLEFDKHGARVTRTTQALCYRTALLDVGQTLLEISSLCAFHEDWDANTSRIMNPRWKIGGAGSEALHVSTWTSVKHEIVFSKVPALVSRVYSNVYRTRLMSEDPDLLEDFTQDKATFWGLANDSASGVVALLKKDRLSAAGSAGQVIGSALAVVAKHYRNEQIRFLSGLKAEHRSMAEQLLRLNEGVAVIQNRRNAAAAVLSSFEAAYDELALIYRGVSGHSHEFIYEAPGEPATPANYGTVIARRRAELASLGRLFDRLAWRLEFTEAGTRAESRFNSDREGWEVHDRWDPLKILVEPKVENGFLRAKLTATASFWYAPEKFRGNKRRLYGSWLRFRMRQGPDEAAGVHTDNGVLGVWIISSSLGDGQDGRVCFSLPYSTQKDWTEYRVPLTEDGWSGYTGGNRISEHDFRMALADIDHLLIWTGKQVRGNNDELDIDDIQLGASR